MANFRRILLPLNGNERVLDYAIDMALKTDAKLFILHAYRLTDLKKNHNGRKNSSIKTGLDEALIEEFKSKYEKRLKDAAIDYELNIEIGFLMDRILANIEEYNIDMVMLEGIEHFKDDSNFEKFHLLNVPVLLVPEKVPVSKAIVE
jgi:SET domain-containing protein